MKRNMLLGLAPLLLTTLATSVAAEEAQAPAAKGPETKELSGMSVLGNSEAPKSLVIVPWKSSEIGDGIGIANMLDNRAQPVDRDVFMRELEFYQLRSESTPRPVGDIAADAVTDTAAGATAEAGTEADSAAALAQQ